MSETPWIDSDDHVQGPFAAHGHFRITFEDGIYLYEAHGPFNEETIRALRPLRIEAVRRWPPPATGGRTLVHWHGSAMMSPQAFGLFADSYQRFAQQVHQLAAVAWVGSPEVEGLELMALHFQPLYDASGTRFRLFQRRDEALAWLQAPA